LLNTQLSRHILQASKSHTFLLKMQLELVYQIILWPVHSIVVINDFFVSEMKGKISEFVAMYQNLDSFCSTCNTYLNELSKSTLGLLGWVILQLIGNKMQTTNHFCNSFTISTKMARQSTNAKHWCENKIALYFKNGQVIFFTCTILFVFFPKKIVSMFK
jgi:hypothetical protein